MPKYKRKKIKKSLFTAKKKFENSDIIMKPSKDKKTGVIPQNKINVVRGAALKRKRATNFFLSVVAFVCTVLLLFSLILPVSVYENIVNITSLIGHGKYPLDISGNTVINAVSNDGYYYVLTDTSITAISNGGKIIMNEMHGFSNPVLCVSETRALVYDQGGRLAYIYNLNGKIHTYEAKYDIITASISRNGHFAVSTHSDNYTSVVNVYDKNLKQIFTWNCAKDIVNNVLVDTKGKQIAITTLNAVSGQYASKMHILNFESADPLFTLDLQSSICLSLVNTGSGVSIITKDKYKHVNWKKFSTGEVSLSGEINLFRNSKNGLLLVFNRANNRTENTVVLISGKGKKYKEFNINSLITDIQYSKGRTYYISDTNVEILDSDGVLLRKCECSYGTERLSVIAPYSVATINDREIQRIDIQKGEN